MDGHPERVLYVDPSFTCTGLFLIDRSEKLLRFDRIKIDHPTMRTYTNYARYALAYAESFSSYLQTCKPLMVTMEIPPPSSQTSAGLTGLSFLLLDRIIKSPNVEQVSLINPASISRMQKKYYSVAASRSRIAIEFVRRQKAQVLGLTVENEVLLEDNDVATAYLFYVFEKLASNMTLTVFPTESFDTNVIISSSSSNNTSTHNSPNPHPARTRAQGNRAIRKVK